MLIKQVLNKLGYNISKFSLYDDAFLVQRELMKKLDIKKPVVFDVGANIGMTSILYNNLFKGNVSIFAFEPFQESYEDAKNRLSSFKNVQLFKLGFSNGKGRKTFYSNKSAATNSLLQSKDDAFDTLGGQQAILTKEEVKVDIDTINNFCEDNKIDSIDILKMDTQGSELDIISGSNRLMETGKVKIIYTECLVQPSYQNQPNLIDYLICFQNNNFELFNFYYPSVVNGILKQVDIIFVHKSIFENLK